MADHHVRRQTIAISQTNAEVAWRAAVPVDDMLAMAQGAILGLSDQAGVRVSSSTAGESIDRWLEAFSSERAANDQGDKMVGHSTGLRTIVAPIAASAEGRTRRQTKDALRVANAAAARDLARRIGLSHAQVNAELNRQVGVHRVAEATVEQLETRLEQADRWLARTA